MSRRVARHFGRFLSTCGSAKGENYFPFPSSVWSLTIMSSRLDLTAPTRYMGTRSLLKDGILCKAKSGRRLHAFLCSDTLVLTDAAAQNLYRMVSDRFLYKILDGI